MNPIRFPLATAIILLCLQTFLPEPLRPKNGLQEVHKRIQILAENDRLRQLIERRIKEFEQTADELKAAEIKSFPPSCTQRLQDLEDLISMCERVCVDLKDTGKIGKLLFVQNHRFTLETLEKQMEKAQQSLQFAITRAIYLQNRELIKAVEDGQERAEATIVHPDSGVYKGAGSKRSRPRLVSKLKVSEVNDLMQVEWIDIQKSVDRYEVRYDDEHEKIWSCKPKEHQHSQKKNVFTLAFGPPKVHAGQQYTISVRAVNSCGPGDWSEPVIFRFKTASPAKPRKPQVIVKSPTEVIVQTRQLNEKEENGSPVQKCVVMYNDINSSEFSNSAFSYDDSKCDPHMVRMQISDLLPDTTYIFRVIMVNNVGQSFPSESCEAVTTQLIPGPPQDLHVSSKRRSSYLKIRWKEPIDNPHAVSKYQIEMRRVYKKEKPWKNLTTVGSEKFSAKVIEGLKSDKKYQFRVRTVNNKGQCSEFSNVVEAETRCGKAARIAAATGAFIGGTVGGPLVGAVTGGGLAVAAGIVVQDHTNSKAGKTAAIAAGIGGSVAGGAAGAVLGTIGAPLIGATYAFGAYHLLGGGGESPQTSDDDELSVGRAPKEALQEA